MKSRFTLLLSCLLITCGGAFAQSHGTYSGDLDVMGQKLTLIFTITAGDDGTDSATLDIPAQGAMGIDVTVATNTSTELKLEVPDLMVSYTGTPASADSIPGTFEQMGYSFPLVLTKDPDGPKKIVRPQDPQPPFPYETEEVTIPGLSDGITLAGTLTYPVEGSYSGEPRLVVMVTGSGPEDRDEEVFDHRPFAVLADYLARQGVATLRYDDRGVGGSVGPVEGMTTADVALDAEAAIRYARSLDRFSSVGVLGHSEGGAVVFILGAKGVPDFGITLAAPGMKGDQIMTDQINYARRRAGMTEEFSVEEVREMSQEGEKNVWVDHFMDYDPAEDIRRTTMPVMAINGEVDRQVFFPGNIDGIRASLPEGEKNFVKSYPGLNHLFQTAKTGDLSEYYSIDETISPEVLRDIADWINAL